MWLYILLFYVLLFWRRLFFLTTVPGYDLGTTHTCHSTILCFFVSSPPTFSVAVRFTPLVNSSAAKKGFTTLAISPERINLTQASIEGDMWRSVVHGSTCWRTNACTASKGGVVFKGRKNSIAWHAHKISIAKTCSTFSTTDNAFLAAKPPFGEEAKWVCKKRVRNESESNQIQIRKNDTNGNKCIQQQVHTTTSRFNNKYTQQQVQPRQQCPLLFSYPLIRGLLSHHLYSKNHKMLGAPTPCFPKPKKPQCNGQSWILVTITKCNNKTSQKAKHTKQQQVDSCSLPPHKHHQKSCSLPLHKPPSCTKKAGNSDNCGLHNLSMRRSDIEANSETPMAK